MISWELLGAWIGAFLVIWIYSFAFKDNALYKLAEHVFVGTAAGYSVALALDSLNRVTIKNLLTQPAVSWHYMIPVILGALMFLKYSRKYYWVARYGVAFNVAIGTALAMRTIPMANIVRQIQATVVPLWGSDPLTVFNNWLMFLITIGGLTYFLFTIFPKKPEAGKTSATYTIYRVISMIGVYGMMVGFGALFANTIMTRVGFVISVYLIYLQPYLEAAVIAVILAVIAVLVGTRRRSK
ncbi:MAG: hypothetical protein QXS42_04140 [Zestosphaera sp.]